MRNVTFYLYVYYLPPLFNFTWRDTFIAFLTFEMCQYLSHDFPKFVLNSICIPRSILYVGNVLMCAKNLNFFKAVRYLMQRFLPQDLKTCLFNTNIFPNLQFIKLWLFIYSLWSVHFIAALCYPSHVSDIQLYL